MPCFPALLYEDDIFIAEFKQMNHEPMLFVRVIENADAFLKFQRNNR